ncbi:hypothetical protein WDW37_16485 [Bdellovibrionota bacterium FG-1]
MAAILMGPFAVAATYSEEINRIQQRAQHIDWGLSKIGVSTREANPIEGGPGDVNSKTRVLQLYPAEAALRAPTGKLLFGTLWTRLVVAPI